MCFISFKGLKFKMHLEHLLPNLSLQELYQGLWACSYRTISIEHLNISMFYYVVLTVNE
jgi:hypothetical protein